MPRQKADPAKLKKSGKWQRPPKLKNPLPLGHVGRPLRYDSGLAPRARKLALLGLTDVEIADNFSIPIDTFYGWKRRFPEFSKALEDGKAPADAEVAASLYQRAIGYDNPNAVKIMQYEGEPIVVPYTEHYPPDVGAQKMWLYNRRPHLWADKKQVEMMGTLEHKISLMSPEERRARLIELQAKAALVIDGVAEEAEE